jgi:hypothetical protein
MARLRFALGFRAGQLRIDGKTIELRWKATCSGRWKNDHESRHGCPARSRRAGGLWAERVEILGDVVRRARDMG